MDGLENIVDKEELTRSALPATNTDRAEGGLKPVESLE
jgi:hypothetical protein